MDNKEQLGERVTDYMDYIFTRLLSRLAALGRGSRAIEDARDLTQETVALILKANPEASTVGTAYIDRALTTAMRNEHRERLRYIKAVEGSGRGLMLTVESPEPKTIAMITLTKNIATLAPAEQEAIRKTVTGEKLEGAAERQRLSRARRKLKELENC